MLIKGNATKDCMSPWRGETQLCSSGWGRRGQRSRSCAALQIRVKEEKTDLTAVQPCRSRWRKRGQRSHSCAILQACSSGWKRKGQRSHSCAALQIMVKEERTEVTQLCSPVALQSCSSGWREERTEISQLCSPAAPNSQLLLVLSSLYYCFKYFHLTSHLQKILSPSLPLKHYKTRQFPFLRSLHPFHRAYYSLLKLLHGPTRKSIIKLFFFLVNCNISP